MKDFEIAMKDFNIVNLMCIGFDGYEEFINGKLKGNEEYKEAEKTFEEHLKTMQEEKGFEYMDKVDNAVITMETAARDTAFNEGFKMGIRFIQDFIAKGEGFKNEKDI